MAEHARMHRSPATIWTRGKRRCREEWMRRRREGENGKPMVCLLQLFPENQGCAAAAAAAIGMPPPPRVLLLCRASPTQPNLAPIQKSLHTRNYDYTLPPWLSRANQTHDQVGTSRYHAIATVRSAITNGQDFSTSWYQYHVVKKDQSNTHERMNIEQFDLNKNN